MELKRLDNIDVLTGRLEEMVDFYSNTLGLRFNLPYARDEGWAGFEAGDVVIYLMEVPSNEHAPRRTPVSAENAAGFDSFAFEVDDLDEAISVLEGRGVEWAGDVIDTPWYRYKGFYDPDGNLLYITYPKLSR